MRPATWGWYLPAGMMALWVCLPLIFVLASWHSPQVEVWQHLAATGLGRLLTNTLVLVVGVGMLVGFLGVSLAWLTAACEFPGRRLFDWALLLPLALPTYVAAFVAMGLMSYSGPVLSLWRELFGQHAWYPDIRHAGGVVLVMGSVLYPYVYMLVRAAFLQQGKTLVDVARTLGQNPWGGFFTVALPMARPAVFTGIALVLMETLADFGAVAVFNFDTFTTAIYKAWFGFGNLPAASQLASLLLFWVALVLGFEQRQQSQTRARGFSQQKHQRFVLRGKWRWLACAYCSLILGLCFVVPVAQLIIWVVKTGLSGLDARFAQLIQHSFVLAGLTALAVALLAIAISFSERFAKRAGLRYLSRFITLGYALPGSVLAVGVMMSFTLIDRYALWPLIGRGEQVQPVLLGSLFALILAYTIRFFAVGLGPIQQGLASVRPHFQEAAQTLGQPFSVILRRIYWPLLRPGLLTGLVLVLVDVMKEMPATLLLRPFGWDTLAVRVYEMTSEGEWQKAALPALCLVLVSIVPVVLAIRRSRQN
ncbi:MAG TPA: iron ABC transporter permease [Cellvibrionaceae bacterium]